MTSSATDQASSVASKQFADPHDEFLRWCVAHPGQSRYLEVDGCRIHYLEWPYSGAAEPLGTLVLVHGFMGHAHWWDFVAPSLAQHYRVLAPDLSGMGDSGYRAEYSLKHYIAEIAAVIRTNVNGKATIVGHSFGGRCTILAAHDHPELIEHIVIVDSHVGFVDEERKRRFNRDKRTEKKRYTELSAAKSRFRLMPEESGTLPFVLDHIAGHSLKKEGDAWVWKFDEHVMERMPKPAMTDAQALPLLKVPMDFVCGEHSAVAPPEHAAKISAAIPKGRGPIVIPAAFHHVPIGQPLALVGTLRALLARSR